MTQRPRCVVSGSVVCEEPGEKLECWQTGDAGSAGPLRRLDVAVELMSVKRVGIPTGVIGAPRIVDGRCRKWDSGWRCWGGCVSGTVFEGSVRCVVGEAVGSGGGGKDWLVVVGGVCDGGEVEGGGVATDRVAHGAVGAGWSVLRAFMARWSLVLLLLLHEIVLPVELLPLSVHGNHRWKVNGEGRRRVVRAGRLALRKIILAKRHVKMSE